MEQALAGLRLTTQVGTDIQTGVIARGQRSTSTAAITTTETGLLRLDNVALRGGRGYGVWVSPANMASTVANDDIIMPIRYSTSGAATTASTLLDYTRGETGDTTHVPKRSILAFIFPGSDATYSFLLAMRRVAGTGNVSLIASDATLHMVVFDMGSAPTDTGVVI
jgi:hypothetical protein